MGKLAVYKAVEASDLHDTELKMYKLGASLKGQPLEIGRMMAFTSGWLENESIWLHMSYKWYLELLRAGLYAQFFKEIQNGARRAQPQVLEDHGHPRVSSCSGLFGGKKRGGQVIKDEAAPHARRGTKGYSRERTRRTRQVVACCSG